MYQIVVYPEAAEQIDALPADVALAFAEVLGVLEMKPWAGPPQYDGNPKAKCACGRSVPDWPDTSCT